MECAITTTHRISLLRGPRASRAGEAHHSPNRRSPPSHRPRYSGDEGVQHPRNYSHFSTLQTEGIQGGRKTPFPQRTEHLHPVGIWDREGPSSLQPQFASLWSSGQRGCNIPVTALTAPPCRLTVSEGGAHHHRTLLHRPSVSGVRMGKADRSHRSFFGFRFVGQQACGR